MSSDDYDRLEIPPAYAGSRFSDLARPVVRELMPTLVAWREGRRQGLVLEGSEASEKLVAASALAMAAASLFKTRPPVFMTLGDVITRQRDTDDYRRCLVIRTVCTCDVLVLADVGTESHVTDYQHTSAVTTFLKVLRQRVGSGLLTVVTTTKTPEDVKALYGSDALELLRKATNATWVGLPDRGDSH